MMSRRNGWKIFYSMMLIFSLAILVQDQAFAGLDDYRLEQQGIIRLLYGYNWLQGNQESFQSIFNQDAGAVSDYQINLSGRLFDQRTHLSYSLLKNPGADLDWTLDLQSPWIRFNYNKKIPVQFSEINLAFQENKIDGVLVETTRRGLTYFQGTESQIPMQIMIPVTPQNRKYYLFDEPSDGDVVEHSEILVLNGQRLEYEKDYTINYLRGEIELFVPVGMGAMLEVKFLFIPTNDQRAEKPGELRGAVASKTWDENIISVYNLERRPPKAEDEVTPPPGLPGEPGGGRRNITRLSSGSMQDAKPIQVKGIATQIRQGPFAFQGEVATSSTFGSTEVEVPAYDLNLQFHEEKIDLLYQLREIPDQFQEIGITSFVKGESSEFDLTYRAEEDVHLGILIKDYVNLEHGQTYRMGEKEGSVKVYTTPNQYGQIILKDLHQELGDQVKDEQDILLGYAFETKPLTIVAGQSLEDRDQRFLNLKAKSPGFYLDGEYYVENLWDGKEHRSQIVCSYDPLPILSFNSLLNYEHLFEAEDGNLRLHLSSGWRPLMELQIRSGYIFFNHAEYKQANHRYNVQTNYLSDHLNFDLLMVKSAGRSETSEVDGYEVVVDNSWNFAGGYQLNYNLDYETSRQYDKVYDEVNQRTFEQLQNLGLSYFWNQNWTSAVGVGYINNATEVFGEYFADESYSLNLDLFYTGEEERKWDSSLGWRFKSYETLFTFSNTLIYPLFGGMIENLCKVDLDWEKKEVSKSQFKVDYQFPTWRRITPKLGYEENYLWKEIGEVQHERQQTISGVLEYNWAENYAIFLEGKREGFTNWLDPSSDFTNLGLYTGLEIEY